MSINPYLLAWAIGMDLGILAALATLQFRSALGIRSAIAVAVAWSGFIVGAKVQYRMEFMPVFEALRLGWHDLLGPGGRLPLGVLLGALLAGAWCLLARVSLSTMGDALAVGIMTAAPIGRLGCLINGCCMGAICPAWARTLCMVPTPGSEAYTDQLVAGFISAAHPTPAPVLPLPLLFALASLLILGVLLVKLRHQAAPGSLLATACLFGPAGKLFLETLRGTARPPGLMLGIPLTALLGSLTILAVQRYRAKGGNEGLTSAGLIGRRSPTT